MRLLRQLDDKNRSLVEKVAYFIEKEILIIQKCLNL